MKPTIKYWLTLTRTPALWTLPHRPGSDRDHLDATMDWLCAAQDATDCGGVSSHYDVWRRQWGQPYRETTGYIIETFLAYARLTGAQSYRDRAIRMGDWELSVQCEDGAVGELRKDGTIRKKIFNTGQVMLGYLSLYQETREKKYLEACKKSAHWLLTQQEADGSWPSFTSRGEAQSIETRVAWPLLAYARLVHDPSIEASAMRHLSWIHGIQLDNGWFQNTSFTIDVAPWTHMIVYTISGLLECSTLLGYSDKKLFDAAYNPAEKLLNLVQQTDAFLPGSLDEHWQSHDHYSCLTGNAQLAIVCMQIYQHTHEKKFLDGALRIIEQLKSIQPIHGPKEIRGGIFGSWPLDGEYAPYWLINWGAKFFADALIMKLTLTP